ncbi:MAG: pilus assembly protein PilM [Planctomycetaceae bacterium]
MSDSIVIEWDRQRLLAAQGTLEARAVRVTQALSIARQDGQLPRELGQDLGDALRKARIETTSAIVVFPRDLVTFNRIQLPNLPDGELPDMVRLQAATRLTVPVESVCLDFAPLPVTAGATSRDVLLVTVPQKHVNDVRETLAAAGLSLDGVRVSSFGLAAAAVHAGLLSKDIQFGAVEAVVAMTSDCIEMILMSELSLAFSHSGAAWTSPEGIEQAVRSEISRARLAAGEDMGNYSVSRLILIGRPDAMAAVPDSISRRLNDAEVVRFNPDSLLQGHLPDDLDASDLLPVIGVIANTQASTVTTVDLINPRKSPEKKDYRRLIQLVAGGSVALALVGGWTWRNNQVNSLTKETELVRQDVSDLKDKYKLGETDLKLDADLEEWQARDLSLLDELQKLKELMGGTDRVFIQSLKFGVRSGKYIAAIEAQGFAKSRRDIDDLMQVLSDAGYEVAPTEINQSLRDPAYKMELRLEVSIPVVQAATARKKV